MAAMEAAQSLPSKAEKFQCLQIRSELLGAAESVGVGAADDRWSQLLGSDALVGHAETVVQLGLPSAAEAEQALLVAVEWLAEALLEEECFRNFYQTFGWTSAEDYFRELGEAQVMFVDVDHNDLDDRLAVVLLAYQIASANAERRTSSPAATCTLYLDGRAYEQAGATIWRTLRLATVLHALLSKHGLAVVPVYTDRAEAVRLAAEFLGVAPAISSLESRMPEMGSTLQGEGAGVLRPQLQGQWPATKGGRVTLWLLSGLCALQVKDIVSGCEESGLSFHVVEQAQPAWQSGAAVLEEVEVQPDWAWPPSETEAERGFGVEPSNVRSGEAPYKEILDTYLTLQRCVSAAASQFTYVCPALAREDGRLPAPPGQAMRRISGRRFNVLPGGQYAVKRALDPSRTKTAFSALLAAAHAADRALYDELCTATRDEAGEERKHMAFLIKYGTFMADAIAVALAARPAGGLKTETVTRRLAVVRLGVKAVEVGESDQRNRVGSCCCLPGGS